MLNLTEKFLFGSSDEPAPQRVYFWNLCSSMIYAVQSAILLLIVTRIGGLNEAGKFSILYVTTQMLAALGSYSMRNYQVSDAKSEYRFQTYYSSRILTCALMMAICAIYWALYQKTTETLLIIAFLGFYRLTDGIEDVYHAEIQKAGRLDAVSLARTVRIFLALIVFAAGYLVTRSLTAASGLLAGLSYIVYLWFNLVFKKRYPELKSSFASDGILPLLITCFPTCASSLLYSYLANAPKYAIEANLTSEMQAIFNIIFMPIFVINVLSMFIYNPMVAGMGVNWQTGRHDVMQRKVVRLSLMIVGVTLFVAVCGYLFGYYLLGLVYGVNLSEWRGLLTILLLFGGISALDAFLVVVLTIMRKHKFVLVGYLISLCFSLLFMNRIVISYQLLGAGLLYGALMGIVLVVFAAITIRYLYFEEKTESA